MLVGFEPGLGSWQVILSHMDLGSIVQPSEGVILCACDEILIYSRSLHA